MLCKSLVFRDQFCNVLLLKSLEQTCGALAHLEHRSLCTVVWFHTGEVPSAKLLKVNGSILVQIQINECIIELLLVELISQLQGKSS